MNQFPELPAFLRLTPSQRAEAWEGVTLRAVPAFTSASVSRTRDEDAATTAFREQEEARRKAKSMAGITRMKARIEAKKIDYTKMRWNPRLSRFEPDEINQSVPAVKILDRDSAVKIRNELDPAGTEAEYSPTRHKLQGDQQLRDNEARNTDWSRVNKDTAERLARLNGVWDDKYTKLSGGLLVMTVKNRLKGLIKKGGTIRWV